MLSAYDSAPPPPARGISGSGNGKKEDAVRNVRESIGILFVMAISLCVLFSSVFVFKYALRDKAVYEELVDYIDKTVSISKINFNPALGVYELRAGELDSLEEHRKYKSLIWTFLFVDLSCLLFFGISAFFYFSVETSRGVIRFLFWFFLSVGLLFALSEVTLFAFLLAPYSGRLANATTALLDHAVPYNPGGLAQMEGRFGCIFDQNLYDTFKRQTNPRNTCDPLLLSSFIPKFLLITFIVLRLIAVLLFCALAVSPQNPLSTLLAKCILRVKPTIRYRKNADGQLGKKLPSYYSHSSPAKTTFGVKELTTVSISSPQLPPATPPLAQMDHSINYNNAAFFAISGAHANYAMGAPGLGGGSSRSSDISLAKCTAIEQTGNGLLAGPELAARRQQSVLSHHLGSTHTTNSLVSEV